MNRQKIGAIISAHTGVFCGDYIAFQRYVEKLMGDKLYELDQQHLTTEIKARSSYDFKSLSLWCSIDQDISDAVYTSVTL